MVQNDFEGRNYAAHRIPAAYSTSAYEENPQSNGQPAGTESQAEPEQQQGVNRNEPFKSFADLTAAYWQEGSTFLWANVFQRHFRAAQNLAQMPENDGGERRRNAGNGANSRWSRFELANFDRTYFRTYNSTLNLTPRCSDNCRTSCSKSARAKCSPFLCTFFSEFSLSAASSFILSFCAFTAFFFFCCSSIFTRFLTPGFLPRFSSSTNGPWLWWPAASSSLVSLSHRHRNMHFVFGYPLHLNFRVLPEIPHKLAIGCFRRISSMESASPSRRQSLGILQCGLAIRRQGRSSKMSTIGKCSICLDNIQLGQAGFLRTCPHGFHRDCIARSLAECNHCPMCRCHASVVDIFTPIVDSAEVPEENVENAPHLALDLCDRDDVRGTSNSSNRWTKNWAPENWAPIRPRNRAMGNGAMAPMRKPIMDCCCIKIETAVKIAAVLGMLLFIVLVLIALLFATRDRTVLHFILAFSFIFICLLIYYLPLTAFQKGQYLEINQDGTMMENVRWTCVRFASFFLSILVAFFAIQTGYLLYIQRTPPCESGQCPSWSSRCSKNFAQLLFFHLDTPPRNNKYDTTDPYPNEGIVERVFETADTARFLKRTILEMAANQTNMVPSNEVLLESQLEPYFDELDHLHMEMNCERNRTRQAVICPEKATKLRHAFMHVYWAQVAAARHQRNDDHHQWPSPREITEDEIDAAFVVPRHCDSIRRALNISIPFLIAHLAILVTFMLGCPMAKWLDWATTCPVQCRSLPIGFSETVKPCEHCPIRRFKSFK